MVACNIAYFVVPASFVTRMQMNIDNGDVMISEGNLDPSKWYEIVETLRDYPNYKRGYVFTGISKDITGKGVVKEVTVISTGNLDPDKYYEIIGITGYLGDYVVGDTVSGMSANITGKGVVKELSNTYPWKNKRFQAVVVGTPDNGKKVIHAILDRAWIKEVKRFLRSDDMTTPEALSALKIQNAYIGKTKESVIAKFPELAGSTGTGEDIVQRFQDNTWSCEE